MGRIKTEHVGHKGSGRKSGYWGTREMAKDSSRSARRQADKESVQPDPPDPHVGRSTRRDRGLTPAREKSLHDFMRSRGIPSYWYHSPLWREFVTKHHLEDQAPKKQAWEQWLDSIRQRMIQSRQDQ